MSTGRGDSVYQLSSPARHRVCWAIIGFRRALGVGSKNSNQAPPQLPYLQQPLYDPSNGPWTTERRAAQGIEPLTYSLRVNRFTTEPGGMPGAPGGTSLRQTSCAPPARPSPRSACPDCGPPSRRPRTWADVHRERLRGTPASASMQRSSLSGRRMVGHRRDLLRYVGWWLAVTPPAPTTPAHRGSRSRGRSAHGPAHRATRGSTIADQPLLERAGSTAWYRCPCRRRRRPARS